MPAKKKATKKKAATKKPRTRIKKDAPDGGLYLDPRSECEFFGSGSTLLDCVLGRGWAERRCINIVGDKSTGKTLLAIEAAANFKLKYPTGIVRYLEAEAAFSKAYAFSLGLPTDTEFAGEGEGEEEIVTIEQWYADLETTRSRADELGLPCLYLVDSLDALSDKAEMDADFDDATYGMTKAKGMSKLFRKIVKRLNRSNVTLMIVSQIRDKIGVKFGKQTQRAGGRGMDFYASQVIWLAHLGRITKTRSDVKRAVGVTIAAKCEKNKIAMPFRDCEFDIIFGFGVEDLKASTKWLIKVGEHRRLFDTKTDAEKFVRDIGKLDDVAYWEEQAVVAEAVREAWAVIEDGFAPKRSKYGARPTAAAEEVAE